MSGNKIPKSQLCAEWVLPIPSRSPFCSHDGHSLRKRHDAMGVKDRAERVSGRSIRKVQLYG